MRALLIAALLAFPGMGRADEVTDAMTSYFDGEIVGGWTLMGMGAVGLATGGALLADGGDVTRGASYVTLGMGTVHLAAGAFVNVTSRVRKRGYRVAIAKSPEAFATLEAQRMRGVSTQFLVLEIVEVGLIAGGATMAVLGRTGDRPRLEGAGYALAAEAAATLVFDIVAARRAHRYQVRLGAVVANEATALVVSGAF